MNTKRQTIWLVSMLSLMVILSAYYLFTDKVEPEGFVAEESLTDDSSLEVIEVGEHVDDIDLDALLAAADQTVGDAKTDNENKVLQKVQAGALTGEEQLAELIRKRNDKLSSETEKLFDITMNTELSSAEIGQAEEKIRMIEEKQAMMDDLEDQLMREYENVVITEDSGNWNVVVQADKLQRSEVVTIIDMVSDQLRVKPNKVAVEYVK